MPLTDISSLIVLSSLGDGWQQLDEEPDFKGEGWDVLTVLLIRDYGTVAKTSEQIAAEWPVGKRLAPGRNFWVVDRKPYRRGGNLWCISLTCFGLADMNRPIKVSLAGNVDSQSIPGETAIAPPMWPWAAIAYKGTVLEAFPALSVSYVLIGSMPPTQKVGAAGTAFQTPPVNLAVRPSFWTYLVDPSIHLPFGWVLTSMPAEMLPGTDTPVSLVTEEWNYRRQFTP